MTKQDTRKLTLHFAQTSTRMRGTNSNPIREHGSAHDRHMPTLSLLRVLHALRCDMERDWPTLNLIGSGDRWWDLTRERDRKRAARDLIESRALCPLEWGEDETLSHRPNSARPYLMALATEIAECEAWISESANYAT